MGKELTEQEQLDLDLKKLDYEERTQALESRKIADELARIQLGEKKKELATVQANKERGKKDAMEAIAARKRSQQYCNHHTGGDGIALMQGQGDLERPTSIGGMQFLDQSFMLFCQRCFKEWRSNLPQGDGASVGPWAEGVALWRRSINKQMMVVGGLIQKKVNQLVA